MTATEVWYAARLGAVAEDPVAAWRAAGADERTAEHWGGLNGATPDTVLGFGATGLQPMGSQGPLAVAWWADDHGQDYVVCARLGAAWAVWWADSDMAFPTEAAAEAAALAAIDATGETWGVVHRPAAPVTH